MANMLWWNVWADVVEEAGVSLSGQVVSRIAPPTPAAAYALAERYMGRIEEHNKLNWPACMAAAWKADYTRTCINHPDIDLGKPEPEPVDYWGEYAESFGEMLAYMVTGSGVSWYDDHATFTIGSEIMGGVREFEVPDFDSGWARAELEGYALASIRGRNKNKYNWHK
jgi:hypothetical protein